jgi:cytochrome c553
MRLRDTLRLAALCTALAATAAQAAAPAKVVLCASCHGDGGHSPYPTFPNLAGQQAGYIAYAIGQYQRHQRLGAQADTMSGIAAQLSTAEIQQLAAYYASLKP